MTGAPAPAERSRMARVLRLLGPRWAWRLTALGALAIYLVAIPARFAQLARVCDAVMCAPGQVGAGDRFALAPTLYAGLLIGLDIVFAAIYVGLAALIALRRPTDTRAIFVSLALVLWGLTFTNTLTALPSQSARWVLPVACLRYLGAALITLFFFVFPDGRFAPRWARWVALAFVASQAPVYFWPDFVALNPNLWPAWLHYPLTAGYLGVMVGVQVYRYRCISTMAQRQQTKWVVLGIAFALSGYTLASTLAGLFAPLPGSAEYALYVAMINVSLLLLPCAIAVAVLYDRLYDIDTLINRSLVYLTLTGLLVALYSLSVYLFGGLARLVTRLPNSSLVIVLSTLGVAALAQPLRARIQRAIDRRFYRRRYNAARVLASFGDTLHHEVDIARLTDRLIDAVERAMEPSHISLVLLSRAAPTMQRAEVTPREGNSG